MNSQPNRYRLFQIRDIPWIAIAIASLLFALYEHHKAIMWRDAADAWVALNAKTTREEIDTIKRQSMPAILPRTQ